MVNDRESGDDVDFVWWGERVNGVEIPRVFEDLGGIWEGSCVVFRE